MSWELSAARNVVASQAGILRILDEFLLTSWRAEVIPFSFMENTRSVFHELILCSAGSEHLATNRGQGFCIFCTHYASL